ncbi:MAG: hypothetical protein PHY14_00645 [Candidatus Gracilibacteria bacterium]|nr:hypothetical protein [Candidatus Gracilibacteria bacterium]
MSQDNLDEELPENEEEKTEETSKIPPVAQKVSRFGPAGFQGGSRFGKGATNFNPPNKQRPGRAAGRGR